MRVKKSVTAQARHRKVKKQTKGMQSARRSSYRLANQALIRALQYRYRDRRLKKRNLRRLWIVRINAGARVHGLTYSELIRHLNQAQISLNRKSLADLAATEPEAFAAIVRQARQLGRRPPSESKTPRSAG